MADTPQTGDPVTQGDSQTTVTTTTVPATDNGSAAEVERLRLENEKMVTRNRQLENEKADRLKAEAEAERKQLAEKEEWKTLAEKAQAEAKELREAQDREARQAALSTATDILFKDYPESVVDVANTAGLALNDDSEAAKATLKEKLDTIQTKVGSGAPITANNPHAPAQAPTNRHELTAPGEGGISPMALASARGDDSVVRQYIRNIPAIDEMRKNAGLPPRQ